MSLVILIGIIVMQVEQSQSISTQDFLFGILPVILASFAYPLGNRKMMEVCTGRLDGYQRVLGMTLAACLFWLLLSLYEMLSAGMPRRTRPYSLLW